MKASKLIARLQDALQKHGDLDVVFEEYVDDPYNRVLPLAGGVRFKWTVYRRPAIGKRTPEYTFDKCLVITERIWQRDRQRRKEYG